mmetsp:Transcript_1707/g.5065  ORF Transcript_1707/g.5065 Transcript_1707/m.5065 type:complete len:330 (-) Transcript_1707:310-1299(-)
MDAANSSLCWTSAFAASSFAAATVVLCSSRTFANKSSLVLCSDVEVFQATLCSSSAFVLASAWLVASTLSSCVAFVHAARSSANACLCAVTAAVASAFAPSRSVRRPVSFTSVSLSYCVCERFHTSHVSSLSARNFWSACLTSATAASAAFACAARFSPRAALMAFASARIVSNVALARVPCASNACLCAVDSCSAWARHSPAASVMRVSNVWPCVRRDTLSCESCAPSASRSTPTLEFVAAWRAAWASSFSCASRAASAASAFCAARACSNLSFAAVASARSAAAVLACSVVIASSFAAWSSKAFFVVAWWLARSALCPAEVAFALAA